MANKPDLKTIIISSIAVVAGVGVSAVVRGMLHPEPKISVNVPHIDVPPPSMTPVSTKTVDAAPKVTLVAGVPSKIGECTDTAITELSHRFPDDPKSGSAVRYANGSIQMSEDTVQGVETSKVGDQVHLCLTDIPKDCPADDERGRTFDAINQRTHEHWTMQNSQHGCGGA